MPKHQHQLWYIPRSIILIGWMQQSKCTAMQDKIARSILKQPFSVEQNTNFDPTSRPHIRGSFEAATLWNRVTTWGSQSKPVTCGEHDTHPPSGSAWYPFGAWHIDNSYSAKVQTSAPTSFEIWSWHFRANIWQPGVGQEPRSTRWIQWLQITEDHHASSNSPNPGIDPSSWVVRLFQAWSFDLRLDREDPMTS